jgi:hypothetical protein
VRWLVIVAVAIRIVAAGVLIGGPWTDEGAELSGWDVERFQELAGEPGRHWVDRPVEYPPGSVLAIELLARGSVVATHRLLAGLSLVADLAIGGLLGRVWSYRAGAAYLLLGLPLVPMGLLRLDLWSVALAVLAAAALVRRRPWLFALAVTAATMVKVWPALLVAAAIGAGRWRAALAGTVAMAGCGLLWLAWAGGSLAPVEQVLTLRGATGWHLESVGGSLSALVTGARPELQLNAYRIGTLNQPAVLAGRALTVGTVAALAALAFRRGRGAGGGTSDSLALGLVMAGGTASLIVTAPLLSPQFLLWLTPWVAIVATGQEGRWSAAVTWLAAAAIALTGLVLAAYRPPDLGRTLPAILLLIRDGLLAGVTVACLAALAEPARPSHRAEDALGDRSPGPGQAGADA